MGHAGGRSYGMHISLQDASRYTAQHQSARVRTTRALCGPLQRHARSHARTPPDLIMRTMSGDLLRHLQSKAAVYVSCLCDQSTFFNFKSSACAHQCSGVCANQSSACRCRNRPSKAPGPAAHRQRHQSLMSTECLSDSQDAISRTSTTHQTEWELSQHIASEWHCTASGQERLGTCGT